jgi:hypothetical protein
MVYVSRNKPVGQTAAAWRPGYDSRQWVQVFLIAQSPTQWIPRFLLRKGPTRMLTIGCAIAQAVRCRLPTAAARVWSRIRSCGGQVALGQFFSEYFSFPCQFSFHRMLHTRHHLSSGAGTIGQILGDVLRGLSHPTPRNLKLTVRCHLTSRSIKHEALLRLLLCAKYWSNLYLKCISPLT